MYSFYNSIWLWIVGSALKFLNAIVFTHLFKYIFEFTASIMTKIFWSGVDKAMCHQGLLVHGLHQYCQLPWFQTNPWWDQSLSLHVMWVICHLVVNRIWSNHVIINTFPWNCWFCFFCRYQSVLLFICFLAQLTFAAGSNILFYILPRAIPKHGLCNCFLQYFVSWVILVVPGNNLVLEFMWDSNLLGVIWLYICNEIHTLKQSCAKFVRWVLHFMY